MTPPSESRRGLHAGVAAYALWGLLPLYFHLISNVGSGEIVAQRVIWSVVLLLLLVTALGRLNLLKDALRSPRILAMLTGSALLIAANWLIYVWAVLNHQILAASMAYFLNPLLNIAMGVALLGERLSRAQGVAVLLASVGVGILALGASNGLWISLALAFSFAIYGLIRKFAPVGSFEGLAVETMILAPMALGYLTWLSLQGGMIFGTDRNVTALLVLAGAVTTLPLLLFAVAARELKLATLGLLQFIAPSLQFIAAITLFDEHLDAQRLASFALIWAGLAVYIGSMLFNRSGKSSN